MRRGHRPRLAAVGLSRRRVSSDRRQEGRPLCDRQSRSDRTRPPAGGQHSPGGRCWCDLSSRRRKLVGRRSSLTMVRFCFLAGIAVFVLSSGLLAARDWVKWDHCEYFEGPHSDGDSIEILRGGKRHVFRLYFVDCVEKNPASAARRAEQGLYFGLKPSGDSALRAAYLARNFTRKQLREPFTVYTRWQPVDPEGDNPAVRGFVETASGEDLAKL